MPPMPCCILKLADKYFEWSTVVDAPVTFAMTLKELERHIKRMYGESGARELPGRLERVEKTGTSFWDSTAAEVISSNRAGPNETELSEADILSRFASQKAYDAWSAGPQRGPASVAQIEAQTKQAKRELA